MSSPQLHVKLSQANGLTRKLVFAPLPTWDELAARVESLFHIPENHGALAYIDDDGDEVTLSSQSELHDLLATMGPGDIDSNVQTVKFTVRDLRGYRERSPSEDTTKTVSTPPVELVREMSVEVDAQAGGVHLVPAPDAADEGVRPEVAASTQPGTGFDAARRNRDGRQGLRGHLHGPHGRHGHFGPHGHRGLHGPRGLHGRHHGPPGIPLVHLPFPFVPYSSGARGIQAPGFEIVRPATAPPAMHFAQAEDEHAAMEVDEQDAIVPTPWADPRMFFGPHVDARGRGRGRHGMFSFPYPPPHPHDGFGHHHHHRAHHSRSRSRSRSLTPEGRHDRFGRDPRHYHDLDHHARGGGRGSFAFFPGPHARGGPGHPRGGRDGHFPFGHFDFADGHDRIGRGFHMGRGGRGGARGFGFGFGFGFGGPGPRGRGTSGPRGLDEDERRIAVAEVGL